MGNDRAADQVPLGTQLGFCPRQLVVGLDVAGGTLAGALAQVAPLPGPWARAIEAHVAASGCVRASETSWQVFAGTPGREGHRWWLWVFGTDEASVFVMDPSRSANVPAAMPGIDRKEAALQAGRRLIIPSGFYGACQSPGAIQGIGPLWCFAHIRRKRSAHSRCVISHHAA